MMKITGAEIVAELLLEQGVDTVFGYPGGAALNVYDALYKYDGKIRHILTAHEQGAAHAADGYARATGKTGVVMATSGPGACNLTTGIATAFMDSIPMVAITSNVAGDLIGRDAFQEIYITGVTLPITKHNFFINNINDLPDAIRQAFKIAQSGRKGPVLVDITKDVTGTMANFESRGPYSIKELPRIDDASLIEIAQLINKAKQPVVYYGGGVGASDGGPALRELLIKADMPGAYTIMAAGVLGYKEKRNLGLIGMHGSVASNKAADQADLILALGTRFSDRVAQNMKKFGSKATIVQVDIDGSEINKNVIVDKSLVCDVKDFIEKILPLIDKKERLDWFEKIDEWKQKSYKPADDDSCLKPHQLIEKICSMTEEDSIYVTDVGQHQIWAAQFIKHIKPKSFLTSGGLGTMGFGYGASIGAKIACPEKRVVHITGDGSFHMNMNEVCTAVTNNLPIISVIFNNKVLGMVYQWQAAFYDKRYSATNVERKTDYVKVAEGFGAKGYKASNLAEFEMAFAKALKDDGPVWIECLIDKEEKVLPMIPNGGTVDDMILG
jgi:acetolactate synthase-1/2/3 large subunit